MLRPFAPHLRLQSVQQLTPELLRRLGINALLLDVDCTLTRYRHEEVSTEVAAWLAEMRGAGIGLCLVSNGRGHRIRRLAERLGVPCVAMALKPFPFGCRRAVRKMGFAPHQTAMVGDQLFADVAAGRLAGLRTIMVAPLHPEDEPWYTRLKRPLERWVLGKEGIGD